MNLIDRYTSNDNPLLVINEQDVTRDVVKILIGYYNKNTIPKLIYPDIEDYIQDMIMKTKQNLHAYDSTKGVLSTWLYKNLRRDFVGKNCLISRKDTKTNLNAETLEDKQIITSEDVEKSTLQKKFIEEVCADMNYVTYLHYVEGYTKKQIAAIMNCTRQNVEKSIKNNTQRIRNKFTEQYQSLQ